MKVHIEPAEYNDRAVTRVVNALKQYAPEHVKIVDNRLDAELSIMQINGRLNRTNIRIENMRQDGIKYALIQYCLKSTMTPHVDDWIDVWEGAEFIWSYYDLPSIAISEDVDPTFADKFYHAPLGVDSSVFKPTNAEKYYLALTTSKNYLSESTREVIIAATHHKGKVAHLGVPLGRHWVDYYRDITDKELADLYSQCYYVSGLRRSEGFELPAAEGLMCGARPIVFDRPHYTNWYEDFAITIPETRRDQIVEDLKDVFNRKYEPVSTEEIERAREVFNWETIIKGFWSWL